MLAGVVLLSDGGDTSAAAERTAAEAGVAVFPIGIGAANVPGDHEVLSVTAAEAVLDDSRVDIGVAAVSHSGEKGPIESAAPGERRVDPDRAGNAGAPDTPVRHVFRASPPAGAPTVYTVETRRSPAIPFPENNTRSVLVPGPVPPAADSC